MALLLMFENSDSLNAKDLQTATKISPEQFPRYVQSLVDAKLLLCDKDEVDNDSTISLNLKYSNKRTKFRIAGTVQRETPQEVEQTHHAIDDDRKMYLQAAIVRIMKSRKMLKHNLLIQEVTNFDPVNFIPNAKSKCYFFFFFLGIKSIKGEICTFHSHDQKMHWKSYRKSLHWEDAKFSWRILLHGVSHTITIY